MFQYKPGLQYKPGVRSLVPIEAGGLYEKFYDIPVLVSKVSSLLSL